MSTPGSVSFVIATLGTRESIKRTLASIETRDGDEIVIVGGKSQVDDPRVTYLPCAPGGDWGHSERNYVADFLTTDYVAHIDDDDWYVEGHRAVMADAIQQAPGRPTLFRMQYPSGMVLWSGYSLVMGNIGTPMMLLPNQREKFGTWGPFNGGDFHFLQTSAWTHEDYNWRPDITVKLGHD